MSLTFDLVADAVAVTTSAKTVLGCKAPANTPIDLLAWWITLDGVDATKGPALVEIGRCTFATNPAGTNSTTVTPLAGGRGQGTETIQTTCGKTWTTEPTVITVIHSFRIQAYFCTPYYLPLFREPIKAAGGGGLVMRVTTTASINASVGFTLRE